MSASTTDSTGLVDTEISYTYDLNGLRNSKTVITNTYAIVRHTVTFVADGVTVKTMTVDDGYVLKDSDYPAVPKKAGYHGNWNKYTGPITGDITIQASYHVPYSCTVTFRADNVIVKVMTVQDGYVLNATDYPSVPKKANYTGVWDVYNGPITTDVTINAIYIPNDSKIPVPTLPPDLEIMSADDEESATETSASATSSPSLHLTDTVTEQHDYIYASGRLLREVITTTDAEGNVTTQTLDFTYDASGSPYSLTYNGTTYYYVVNLQGDVIRLVSANGATVAEYSYDPYGKVVSASGTMAEVNPLRYRGYYYDTDAEFYYLQSRYYDPAICRFINADGYASTGQEFIGFNMFAYCLNNPINYSDFGGVRAEEATPNSKDDEQENNQTTVVYYESSVAAARAFGRQYLAGSVSAGVEYGVNIYSTIQDGEVYYYFRNDQVCVGTRENVLIEGEPLNAGDKLAATVHTHVIRDISSLDFSRKYDFPAALASYEENNDFVAYMIGPDGDMRMLEIQSDNSGVSGITSPIGTIYGKKKGRHKIVVTSNMIY